MKDNVTLDELQLALDESTLDWAMKSDISQRLQGYAQGVYNLLKDGPNGQTMSLINHPDNWGIGYNFLVSTVQEHSK